MGQQGWDSQWPDETGVMAYEAGRAMEALVVGWADSIDAKVIGVFGVASIIVTLGPALQEAKTPMPAPLLAAAVLCFLGAAWNCYQAYHPKPFKVGPSPEVVQCKEWLALPPGKYRFRMLGFMGKALRRNEAVLKHKSDALRHALVWTAGEVLALVLGFVVVQW